MMDLELMDRALDYIGAHPDEWDQENWRTCLAGHMARLSGHPEPLVGSDVLRITGERPEHDVFHCENTLSNLHRWRELLDPDRDDITCGEMFSTVEDFTERYVVTADGTLTDEQAADVTDELCADGLLIWVHSRNAYTWGVPLGEFEKHFNAILVNTHAKAAHSCTVCRPTSQWA